jgi:uroporphyrinogen-III synthase
MSDVLAGCYVISLRPVGQHAPLHHAAAAFGARMLTLSPWRLQQRDDAEARDILRAALQCERVLFTSQAAVRAAAALQPLCQQPGQRWLAVGNGTARALAIAGVDGVRVPLRMDSEGLLQSDELRDVATRRIGLVTAPGGRDLLAPRLHARGAEIVRADVYARVPIPLSSRAVATLAGLDVPRWLALSSGGALSLVLPQLPDAARERLLGARVAASSARLVALARSLGFASVVEAAGPGPRELLAAIVDDASASMRAIAASRTAP